METDATWAHNLLLDAFCFDQSLFGCLGDSREMSLARSLWGACVFGGFNVKCWIHLSNSLGAALYCALGSGCQEESFVIISEGCCISDLFGAAAEIVLVHYSIIMASSMTHISSAPVTLPPFLRPLGLLIPLQCLNPDEEQTVWCDHCSLSR